MGLKTIIFFLSTCFVVLLSLEAIADDISAPDQPEDASFLKGQKEAVKSLATTEEAPAKCEEKTNITAPEKTPETKTAVSSSSKNSNLSFNFIYYILYKFKYIDSFGLSSPEKSRSKRNQENVVWH